MYVPRPAERDILQRLERSERRTLRIALICTGAPFLAIGIFKILTWMSTVASWDLNVILDKIHNEDSVLYLLIGLIYVGSAYALSRGRATFRRWLTIASWVVVSIFFALFVAYIILRFCC
jgi:hypothetical protein